jgi:hypothetical protein
MEDKQEGAGEIQPGATVRPGDAATTQSASAQATPISSQGLVQQPAVNRQEVEARYISEDPNAISWTASEYIDHDKSFDWYLGLAVAAVLSAAALYIFFRDIITSVTPLVAALALGIYARRQPRQLHYQVDSEGIAISNKFLPYESFRSFAIMDEGPFVSIAFLPLKRFGLLTTVYLDPKDEDRIIDVISQHLPLEPRDHDPVERLMKRIRF